jgi:hypothetical protein
VNINRSSSAAMLLDDQIGFGYVIVAIVDSISELPKSRISSYSGYGNMPKMDGLRPPGYSSKTNRGAEIVIFCTAPAIADFSSGLSIGKRLPLLSYTAGVGTASLVFKQLFAILIG